jgi:hypothetical protein
VNAAGAERAELSRASLALYIGIGTAAVVLALLPVSAALQRRVLESHHLRPSSTASWVIVGLLPKMYGGRHEAWLSPEPLTPYLREDPSRAPFEVVHQWVNHFPARLVRLDTARDVAARTGVSTYLRLESSYRAASLTTTYTIRAMDGRIEARPTP